MPHLFDISAILSSYGYIGIFLIVFIESGIFFALPGDSLIFAAGLLASTAGGNIYLLIALIFIATLGGGIAGYFMGSYLPKLKRYSLGKKIFKDEYIEEARLFFISHGRAAVIFSRFVPIMRTFTPIVAGVGRMEKSLYTQYSAVGAILWSLSIPLLGFFLGQVFPGVEKYVTLIVIVILVVSVLPGIAHLVLRKRR